VAGGDVTDCDGCGRDLDGTPAYYGRWCSVRCTNHAFTPPRVRVERPHKKGWWTKAKAPAGSFRSEIGRGGAWSNQGW